MPPKRKSIHVNEDNLQNSNSDVEMAKRFGMFFLFRRYAEVSSVSGVPQLQRSQEIVRSIIWTLIVLAGCGVLIWQCQVAILKYLSNGVTTVVTRKPENALDFPAVTLCNQNPVDYKKLISISSNIYNITKSWVPANQSSSPPPSTESKQSNIYYTFVMRNDQNNIFL